MSFQVFGFQLIWISSTIIIHCVTKLFKSQPYYVLLILITYKWTHKQVKVAAKFITSQCINS